MSAKMIALYPGTFDPFHVGHLDVVKRAARIFDKVIITMATNNSKPERMFDVERMKTAIENTIADKTLENVSLLVWDKSIASAAKACGAGYIVRGVRNAADMDYEATVAHADNLLYGRERLEHVYLLTTPSLANVSSTLIRELVRCNAPMQAFHDLVPYEVARVLCDEFHIEFADERVSGKW